MTVMHNVYDPSIIDSWNPILGRAKGAFNPFGSSSGSAISLALGWCASSIGGEISGSIIAPCSSAALYGLKPTVGLISDGCEGNLEISERYDVAGPMGKTVQDLEMMLDVMAKDSDKSKLKPTTPAGRAQGKEGKWRVAVLDYAPHFGDAPDPDAPAKVHYDASIAKLHSHSAFEMLFESSSELAAKCASAPTFPKGIWKITGDAMFADSAGGRKHSSSAMYTHFAADSYHLYNRFLSQLNWPAGVAPIRMAEELVEALKNMPNQHVDESGTDGSVKHLDSMLAGKGNKESPEYKDATKFCDEAKEELRAFTRDNKLDAIIGPLRMYSLSGIGATPLVSGFAL